MVLRPLLIHREKMKFDSYLIPTQKSFAGGLKNYMSKGNNTKG
jgi:hypothetical protein